MLYTYLRKSKAYFDGTRVLIDGGKTFRILSAPTRTASADQKADHGCVRYGGAHWPL